MTRSTSGETKRTLTQFEVMDQNYRGAVEDIANRLRALADQFEDDARVRDEALPMCPPRYTLAAEMGMNGLLLGIARLGAQGLIGRAGDADAAERSPEDRAQGEGRRPNG